MGKLGKETKNLLLAITVICLISFLLAAGISFLFAKDFQHEMLLHDYGVSGYQLNHEDKLQISAFTAHPNESDIERGKEALASIGYSEANYDVNKIEVSLASTQGQICVCQNGRGYPFSEEKALEILSEDEIEIFINLYDGDFQATAWGCDLTYDYVKINGDYRT